MNDVNFLLKEEDVTLTQVLEADDILQECRADNQALRQFLTKPEIRAELITLITEEPSKNLELTTQYRHANIACEVLTSQLPTLRDRLAMDPVQMNRLCDFVNKDPPLNPLLASYFSKTIEMLFERSPKQDWYAHHIVCLHVLDCFKSRRDFLPNLLMHISTSAICDVFKCFLYLEDPFNKIIMEWLDEHQILENFIQVICGTYEPGTVWPASTALPPVNNAKGQQELTDKVDSNHNASQPPNGAAPDNNLNDVHKEADTNEINSESDEITKKKEDGTQDTTNDENTNTESAAVDEEMRADRIRHVASANAAALLCEVTLYNSCGGDVWPVNAMSCTNTGAGSALCARLRSEAGVRALLQAAFTAPPRTARSALVHASGLLLALLAAPAAPPGESESEEVLCVERAVAPHVPLLHHALLRPPRRARPHSQHNQDNMPQSDGQNEKEADAEEKEEGVGVARVSVAGVLARLARSEVHDVLTALLSLGTAGILVEMFFQYPENNFLHAQVLSFVRHALANRLYGERYTKHLIEECNLLTRLMDAFEENEDKLAAGERMRSRAGYMGHAVSLLRVLDEAGVGGEAQEAQRWASFRVERLRPLLQRHDMPLGGIHPSDNQYDTESPEALGGTYDLGEGVEGVECVDADDADTADTPEMADEETRRREEIRIQNAEMHFLEMADQRYDELWGDDAEGAEDDVVQQVLADVSPWECCEGGGGAQGGSAGEAGWAQFGEAFASADWPESDKQEGMENRTQVLPEADRLQDVLTMELAQKMLTAINSLGDEACDTHPTATATPADASSPTDGPPPPTDDPAER